MYGEGVINNNNIVIFIVKEKCYYNKRGIGNIK